MPRTSGLRGLAGVLSALGLGCGAMTCGTPSQEAKGPSPAPESAQAPSSTSSSRRSNATSEDEVLPAYNDEALAARVSAQRALLGNSLFEDIEGNPVAPRIDVADEPDEWESIDDDILFSLPGSAGFGPEGGALVASADHDAKAANGNALGLYVPIEDPREGDPLAHFHQALRDLRAGRDEDGKVRVLVYGASAVQADIYPNYMRSYWQSRFGNGGQGFVGINRVNKWFHYADWAIEDTRGWTTEYAQRASSRKDGLWGMLGFSGSSDSKRDRAKLVPRHDDAPGQSRYELWYLAQPDGGRLQLYADGKKLATIDTSKHEGAKAQDFAPGYYPFELDEAQHEIEVRVAGGGEVRLFGLVMEREEPGVVVDTLGISGTRAANMLKWDEEIWAKHLARRRPDLFTLAFGTNEATDTNQPISDYRANLREVLTRLRKYAPEASCVMISPGDFPREVEEDVWVPRPRVLEIIEVQRDLAYEMGCGFWDNLAFMGGVNSMHTWATSRPRMASRDHIHLSKRGYVRLGMALTDAIMADFDRRG